MKAACSEFTYKGKIYYSHFLLRNNLSCIAYERFKNDEKFVNKNIGAKGFMQTYSNAISSGRIKHGDLYRGFMHRDLGIVEISDESNGLGSTLG